MTRVEKINRSVIYYKGFGINFYASEYVAAAYANPTFTNTNLSKLKKQINNYLRGK